MNIIFIGYMGSGKSTIGQKLAELLEYDFIDLDAYIQIKEGKSISELFKTKGEIYFRKIESQYLLEVLNLKDKIISLGGGTPCYGNNMQCISSSENSKSIYLKSSIPNLVERLYHERSDRPLIAHLDNEVDMTEFIGKHLFERSAFYSQADIIISVDKKSLNDLVEELILELF